MLKIMIVDDEKRIVDGMNFIFQRFLPQHEIVAALQNPLEVFEVLKNNTIDIVFTDVKMPEITGVDLTARICTEFPKTFIVVLSAYSDFDFVRKCMKNGAYDYLLKPAPYQSIVDITQRIEALVIKTRKKEHHDRESQLMLAALLEQEPLPKPWNDTPDLQMFVCLPLPIPEFLNTDLSAQDFFDESMENVSAPFHSEGYTALLCAEPLELQKAKKLMERYVKRFQDKHIELYYAIHNFKNCPGALKTSFKRCKLIIDFFIFNKLSHVAGTDEFAQYLEASDEIDVSKYISGKYIVKLIENEFDKIEPYLKAGVNSIFARHKYVNPIKMKISLLEELYIVTCEFQDRSFSSISSEWTKTGLLSELSLLKHREQLIEWLMINITDILNSDTKLRLPNYIQRAIEYVNTNYMNDISLKDVADHIYLNPWYFSTQFKKTMQIGFAEYLNKVRIKFSKELLKQNDLKIYQIAEMVGFKEPTYFNTVFKKIESISPKDYRNRM